MNDEISSPAEPANAPVKPARKPVHLPRKPWPDFPLFPHRNGSWMTTGKFAGRHVAMGGWKHDPEGNAAYADYKKWLRTGEREEQEGRDCSMDLLANEFLLAKAREHAAGELSPRTYSDYAAIVKAFIRFTGRTRMVSDLNPELFTRYRSQLLSRGSGSPATLPATPEEKARNAKPKKRRGRPACGLGPHALNRHIVSLRHMFSWAEDTDLIERAPKIKRVFEPVPVATFRRHRGAVEKEHGKKIFSAEEIRKILTLTLVKSDPILRAWVLLGVNCGFGNTDIARLDIQDVDFKRRCFDSMRQKTQVRRIAPLWSETIAALKEAMPLRPKAAEKGLESRLFLTDTGRPVVDEILTHSEVDGELLASRERDWVQERFSEALGQLKLTQRGRSFYSLRRTFRTLADEVRDDRACAVIMGHSVGDVAELYIWDLAKDRLRNVVDKVHARLAPLFKKPKRPVKPKQPK